MKKKAFMAISLVIFLILIAGIVFICSKTFPGKESVPDTSQVKPTFEQKSSEIEIESSVQDTKQVDTQEEVQPETQLKIVAVGDILLGRGVGMRIERDQKGYIYPFELVAPILKTGDVIFANIEEPFTDSTHSLNPNMKYVLKNKMESFEAIKHAGINIVNLANNHILDYYEKGLFDTLELLDSNGIAHAGSGKNLEEARKPAIIEKNNTKIGMISYTDMAEYIYDGKPQISFAAGENKAGVAPRKMEYILEDIEKLRGEVDILMVSLHWGIEESFEIPAEQREFAYKIMDAGADIILGHHPHQFQGIEIYNGRPIIYSLGNFIFDQNDPENQEAFIMNLEYTGNKLSKMTAMPTRTIGKTQVVPLDYEDAVEMLEREVELCAELDTECIIEDNILVFKIN
jgi:poly-gamma-glutamate capsule biosynthesis protein CapA/YwtB (metallophosphatase superfamily)